MSDSGQSRRDREGREHVEEETQPAADTQETARELLDDVDELLDEIDDVLEENAEEFIKNYVQKGGQ